MAPGVVCGRSCGALLAVLSCGGIVARLSSSPLLWPSVASCAVSSSPSLFVGYCLVCDHLLYSAYLWRVASLVPVCASFVVW